MSEPPATALSGPGTVPEPPAQLEPNAIGVTQDTIIGMASSAPAAVVALTLASLAATSNYGGGVILLISAVPMLIIANAYRRLNMWSANAGASFEWVGRAINPYLGFLTGWLMIVGFIVGTLSGVVVLGPSVLAIAGSSATSTWPNVGIATAVGLVMLVIAVVGIRITARVQVVMALVEYLILVGMSIWGLVYVLGHHAGSYPVTSGWFSPSGIGGQGSIVGGFLIAVFAYSGWDGGIYVNEEVRERRVNPGRAVLIAVALLAVIYTLAQVGLQGVISPKDLAANSGTALISVATALGGAGWAKVMALSIALSVVATTGAGIVVGARIVFGMARYRALPAVLATVNRRFATPAAASVLFGLLVVALAWVYLLATSVQNAFNDVVDITGLVFALFYVLTGLASIVYYRRRIFSAGRDAVILGAAPIASAAFLLWMVVKYLTTAPASQVWSMIGIILSGLVMMAVSRFWLKSPFFAVQRESDPGQGARTA
ncbi:MAG: APC family permease [Trebonia sp.]